MEIHPTFEEFSSSAKAGTFVPVWGEFLFDRDTAVTAFFKIQKAPFGFLLESVVGGEKWARYTFMGSRPREAWKLEGDQVSTWTPDEGWQKQEIEDPLADLQARLTRAEPQPDSRLPRLWGGVVGYFGYDLVRRFEALGDGPPDDLDVPTAMVMFADTVLAVDNLLGRAKAIATVEITGTNSEELRACYDDSVARIQSLVGDLHTGSSPDPVEFGSEPDLDPPFTSNVTREKFLADVERIRQYIFAGDAFQVVLSQRLSVPFPHSPFDLYRVLRSLNPSPYLYFLELDGVTLVGSSPEVLVRLEDDVVTVRPIAGTRPRGVTEAQDEVFATDLLADEKELAEHRMLVDLGRNDVGRVCKYGTVRVPDLMVIERYSHVMHVCSQVEGDVNDDLSALQVLAACFPAGTLSGAPKVRAMEIIDELEPTRRGPYGGAVGHISWGGQQMDVAIAIRTMLVKDQTAYVQAGAGIVADSDPESEFEETLNKARAVLRAVAILDAGSAS